MSQFLQDLRIALRGFVRQPTISLTVVLTLALGIGANTAIFSFVDSVLLTPPPFREPDRVVVLWAENPQVSKAFGLDQLPISNAVFYDLQRESTSFDAMGMLQSDRMTLTGRGEPVQVGVVKVAGDFFGALGTSAAVGRTLVPEDDEPGNPTAVVLAHKFWRRQFNADPGIVGETITLNDKPLSVVGVMPPRFAFPRGGSEVNAAYSFALEPDAWVTFGLSIEERHTRTGRFSLGVARLKPGVDIAVAEEEVRSICANLAGEHPQTDTGWSAFLVPIREQISGGLRPALLMLWAAGGLVLLIASVNVANLLFARAMSRYKEVALRSAIGASRRRVLAQLLNESAVLSVVGGLVGIVLAVAGLRLCEVTFPPGVAGAATFSLNFRALVFTAILCVVTTFLAGLLPAFRMARSNIAGSLRDGTRSGASSTGVRRLRSVLVVAEVALAVLLLIGTGLLLRSFVQLLQTDPGFPTESVFTFRIDLPPEGYPPPARVEFFDRLVGELHSVSGIERAAAISELPLSGAEQFMNLIFEGRPAPQEGEFWSAGMHSTTPEYFEAMGIPLKDGRPLNQGDNADAPLVAVIDESMAETYWPDENPLGKRMHFGTAPMEDPPWITVVGIVGNVRHTGLDNPPKPNMYVTTAQVPQVLTPYYVWFTVRGDLPRQTMINAARSAVHAVDENQPITEMRSMGQVVSDSMKDRRFILVLASLFAGLALVLAVVGIYGLISYSVAQRNREWGLRVALGARPGQLHALVLKEAALLAILGVVLGVAAAFILIRVVATQVVAGFLYEVPATDPLTFAAVALGLTLVALVAAYLPARRASRADPIVALQTE